VVDSADGDIRGRDRFGPAGAQRLTQQQALSQLASVHVTEWSDDDLLDVVPVASIPSQEATVTTTRADYFRYLACATHDVFQGGMPPNVRKGLLP